MSQSTPIFDIPAAGALPRPSAATRTILIASSAIAVAIGASILLDPVAFHASNGIAFDTNASTMSEVRAPGAALLVLGAMMAFGAFVRSLSTMSMSIAAAVYLSYGFARVLSFGLDGLPAVGLIAATGIELALGALCIASLIAGARTQAALARTMEGGA